MITKISGLLSTEQLYAVQSVLRQCTFIDGKITAGVNATPGKHNREASLSQDQFDALNDVVMTSLVKHADYLDAALPLKLAAPIYARYTHGMHYDDHIDDPVMGTSARYRSDVSITIFLNNPDDYNGGELCIETGFGQQKIKLPAGHAVLYPSSSRHSVLPVTEGERLVAVTWLQSMIRSAEHRQILYQLAQARDNLSDDDNWHVRKLLESSYVNLVRMWAEV